MDTSSIKGQFTRFIKETMGSKNPRLNGWYCGITNNENRRKAEHNYVKGKTSKWVYIFKMPSNKKMGLGGVLDTQSLFNQVFG